MMVDQVVLSRLTELRVAMAWGMHMNTGAEAKDSLRKRAADELREFLIIAAYL